MKSKKRISKRGLNPYNNFMDSQNSSNQKIEIVYPEPVKELDEQTHYNNQELAKKINELIRKSK